MVEIRYDDNYEAADLAGQPVSEARQQFKAEFGIPDKAGAKLNGKKLKGELESETMLSDDDRLTFAEAKSRKGAFFVGAVLLAFAITGGTFAWTATTDTVSLGLTEKAEFVDVAPQTPPTWNVFGGYKGTVTAGELFKITPADGYTADLSASVLLANSDNLVAAYRVLVMKISVYGDDTGPDLTDRLAGPRFLSLSKGEVTFDISGLSNSEPGWVYLDSGFYVSHHWGWSAGEEDPLLLCDVAQKGT